MTTQTTRIVVTVLEGRHFIRNPSSKIYIQCRFNTEILTTNPTQYLSEPIWDTELSWEVESKALSYLKSQRATLKLIVHSIDGQNRRDTLGYIVLDLRAASQKASAVEKWYPLINSKVGGAFRPEIKLSFCATLSSELMPKVVKKKAITTENHQEIIKPISVPYSLLESGVYRIRNGKTRWTFSITIAFAENLNLLTEDSSLADYRFQFKFLETEFTTEKFQDPRNPIFSTERFVVALEGAKSDLISFIKEISRISIYLYKDTEILGQTYVPISALIMGGIGKDFPLIENVYNVFDTNQTIPMSHDSRVPNIGVSMSITPEDVIEKMIASKVIGEKLCSHKVENKLPESPKTPLAAASPPLAAKATPKREIDDEAYQKPPPVPIPSWKPAEPERSPNNHSWRQYRFSIDLLEVQDFRMKETVVYMRYSYAPFGSSTSVHTPATAISSMQKTAHLVHSFSAFEFIMNFERLKTYLEGVPLVIELWKRDVKDACLGITSIDLSQVLRAPKNQSNEGTESFKIQSCDVTTLVSGTENYNFQKICDIKTNIVLEDFGEVENDIHVDIPEDDEKYISDPIDDAVHQTEHTNVALQLEVWKRQEEQKFRDALLVKEKELLSKLSVEWKKRDQERESVLQQKVDNFKKLELQVQHLLRDLEDRERKVLNSEENILKRREDLERDHRRRVDEARDASRRLHDEYKHQMELQKHHLEEAENRCRLAVSERKEIEDRHKQMEREISELRLSLKETPDTAMKDEISRLVSKVQALEKDLDQSEKSRRHYKSMYTKTLKELSAVKKGQEMESEEKVIKERRELEILKLQQFTKDDLMKSKYEDGRILNDIKKELDELKHRSFSGKSRSFDDDENVDPGEVERLQRERSGLLDSGVYSKDDLIIAEMDRRIRSLVG